MVQLALYHVLAASYREPRKPRMEDSCFFYSFVHNGIFGP